MFYQYGAIYQGPILDMDNYTLATWIAGGNVLIQTRTSLDYTLWTTWSELIDATTTTQYAKTLRYLQYRVIFPNETWTDFASYFKFLSLL